MNAYMDFQVGAAFVFLSINYERMIFSNTMLKSHTYFHLFKKSQGRLWKDFHS